MHVVRTAAFIATAIVYALAGSVIVHGQTYQGRQLVKAELLADTSSLVSGKPFTAGLLLRMAPNWHTYWKFSGDAGLPTEIKWNLPPGWKVGEIQWPIPRKTVDPGDIQTYGYQDEVMLLQEITPPQNIEGSVISISAEANWLVCERLCIPGSAKLSITLPTSSTAAPANTDLFERYRNLLPKSGPPGDVKLRAARAGANDLSVTLSGGTVTKYRFTDFYPMPDERSLVGHPHAQIDGDQIGITVPFENNAPDQLAGLVVLGQTENDQNRVGWYISADTKIAAGTESATATVPTSRLATFLFFGFVGGFILNLMPCVLPVISLKIFGFIRQSGKDRRSIIRSGMWFVAGIFVWFVGLSLLLVILKAAGHQVTWAAQFTNPYFVLTLAVVVLVFALDLFGVFEITLPQAVMHRMLDSATREGEAGSFFQGVFATMLATPCTAPFLGTAVGFAFTQSAVVIVSMFIAVAAGMSAPYLVLSANPGWLRFLPKPGPWMIHLKQFMGFLLLGTLLFLLYVVGAERGVEGAVWASAFLLIVALACWMKGAFVLPTISVIKRYVAIAAILLLLLGSGFYFIGDKFRNSTTETFTAQGTDNWQPFTPERLQNELAQSHPVFIDFTAAWCITCKFNEKTVLESGDVRDAFQRRGIVKFRADWTNGDPAITKLLQQFGRPGVPLYVLYPGQEGKPFVFPELLTKGMILQKLETIPAAVASR